MTDGERQNTKNNSKQADEISGILKHVATELWTLLSRERAWEKPTVKFSHFDWSLAREFSPNGIYAKLYSELSERVAQELTNIEGRPLQTLERVLRAPSPSTAAQIENAGSDADWYVTWAAVFTAGNIGEAAVPLLVSQLPREDSGLSLALVEFSKMELSNMASRGIAVGDLTIPLLESNDLDTARGALQALRYLLDNIPTFSEQDAINNIMEELVVRTSGRPNEYFSGDVVDEALRLVTKGRPRARSQLIQRLATEAYQYTGDIRGRIISTAKLLGEGEFAARVKARAKENPAATADIMSTLGGSEAAAFFAEEQSRRLADYRRPLVELEDVSLTRWNELSRQAGYSFLTSTVMSFGLFFLGATIIVWGLVLLTLSPDLSQQLSGGSLAALAAFLTTFSGRFWKDPAEHIQNFSAQQARLQAAFIGYMNRAGQLRLLFEHDYEAGHVSLDDMASFQMMLSDAINQASEQLRVDEDAASKQKM
jgi:hypothetical protein